MNYVARIDTATLTLKSNPKITRVPISLGLLYHFEVYFPPGPSGYLHVVLMDGAHQVYPQNEGTDYTGDNVNIVFDDLYSKMVTPPELQIITWSEDDTYTQTVIVRFNILPPDLFSARFAPQLTSTQLDTIIALLEKQQNIPLTDTAQALLAAYAQPNQGGTE